MSDNRATVGAPILGLLGLVFVTLKLTGIGVVATWSWWWVLAPFWVPLGLAALVTVILFLGIVAFSWARSRS